MPRAVRLPRAPAVATVLLILFGAWFLTLAHPPGGPVPWRDPGYAWYPDMAKFAAYGNALLAGHLDQVYRDPWNQAGPLQVLLDAFAHRFALALGWPDGPSVLQTVGQAGLLTIVALLTVVLTRATVLRRSRIVAWLPAITVAVTVLAFPALVLYVNGHWAQLPVYALWLATGLMIARGRWAIAGFLLAGTMLLEPWGILGMLLVTVGTQPWRTRVRAVTVAAAVTAAGWVPFAVQPGFAFTEHVWKVFPGSLWDPLLTGTTSIPWSLRLIQAVLIVTVALTVRWRINTRLPAAWTGWAVILTIALTRNAFEIRWLHYYQSAANMFLIAGAVVLLAAWTWRALPISVTAVLTAHWLTYPLLWQTPGAPYGAYGLIVLTVFLTAVLPGSRWPVFDLGPSVGQEQRL